MDREWMLRHAFGFNRRGMRQVMRVDPASPMVDYFYVAAKQALWQWRAARWEAK